MFGRIMSNTFVLIIAVVLGLAVGIGLLNLFTSRARADEPMRATTQAERFENFAKQRNEAAYEDALNTWSELRSNQPNPQRSVVRVDNLSAACHTSFGSARGVGGRVLTYSPYYQRYGSGCWQSGYQRAYRQRYSYTRTYPNDQICVPVEIINPYTYPYWLRQLNP